MADGVVGLGMEAGECSNRDSADLRQHRHCILERKVAPCQAWEHAGKYEEKFDGNDSKGSATTVFGKQ